MLSCFPLLPFFLFSISMSSSLSLHTRRTFLRTAWERTLAAGMLASLPVSLLNAAELNAAEQKSTKKPLYSCSSINFMSLSLEKACERIAELGFDAIDIWGGLGCQHLKQVADELKPEGLKTILEKNCLKLCGFSLYGVGYAPYAKLLGQCGGGIAIHGSRRRGEGSVTEDMKKYMDEIKPLLDLCEENNSFLAIENHGGGDLLNKMDTLKAFVDLNKSKRLGIALAPYHVMNNHESVAEAIRVCGSQLLFFYFWTNEKDEKQMPGMGQTDVSDWFRALDDIGYPCYLNPFMHHEPLPDRMSELHRTTRRYLDKTYESVASAQRR